MVHVSMASGGAYVGIYAGFWDQIEAVPAGRRFQDTIKSLSGSSAGALVSTTQALGVPARTVVSDTMSGGFKGRFPYVRMALVALGWKKSMYSGTAYVKRMQALCAGHPTILTPISIALTTENLEQVSKQYTRLDSVNSLLNSAVASASIPYVLEPRLVPSLGLCVDGSVDHASYPNATVMDKVRTSSGSLVLVNCMPWPGYRHEQHSKGHRVGASRLAVRYADDLYRHQLEPVTDTFDPAFKFKDGIFDVQLDNTGDTIRYDANGNLKVIFVAPTREQFLQCGGLRKASMLSWRRNNQHIREMVHVGRQIAQAFLHEYGTILL